MKEIKLSQGKVAIVDDEDFDNIHQFKWRASKGRHTFYAVRWNPQEGKYFVLEHMHRVILNAPIGMQIDHIDGDGLNNQKSNLRLVSCRGNLQNHAMREHQKHSKFPGVSWDKGMSRKKRWIAKIRINGTLKHLGYFETEEEAYECYKGACSKLEI